jgi:hypothetical protein
MIKKILKMMFVLLVIAGIAFSVTNFMAKEAYTINEPEKFDREKMTCKGEGRDCLWTDPAPGN